MPTTCPCPNCQKLLSVPDEHLGAEVQCPSCDNQFIARIGQSPEPQVGDYRSAITEAPPPRYSEAGMQREHPEPAGPYDDPYAAPSDYDATHHPYTPQYRILPGNGKAIAAMVMLGITILSLVGDIFLGQAELQLMRRIQADPAFPRAEAITFDQRMATIGVFQVALHIGTVVVFCIWIFQAYRNLNYLHVAGYQNSAGWAVGWFFIPIANLFKPYQVVQEIWRASNPHGDIQDSRAWKRNAGSGLIVLWWIVWIVGNITNQVALRMALRNNNNIEQILSGIQIGIAGNIIHIVAALVVISIIYQIRKRQNQRNERLFAEAESPGVDLMR